MSERPEIALSLSNLDAGLDFFVNRLGFTLQHHQPEEDMASVLDFDGDLILFVGPKVENAKAHLGGVALRLPFCG